MVNNTAPTGSTLFGGSVDSCWSKSMLVDNKKVPFTYPEGKWIFDAIFEIKPSKANDTSVSFRYVTVDLPGIYNMLQNRPLLSEHMHGWPQKYVVRQIKGTPIDPSS